MVLYSNVFSYRTEGTDMLLWTEVLNMNTEMWGIDLLKCEWMVMCLLTTPEL